MTAPLCRNLELKVRYPDLAAARQAIAALPIRHREVQVQTDTYFHVPHGRLKLREIDTTRAELVWYDRPNAADVRTSRFYVIPVPDPNALKAALTAALGLRGVVRKRREIYLYHNVRIHLDEVQDLGDFIEFEAAMTPAEDDAASNARLDDLCRILKIDRRETIGPSYSDLLGLP